MDYKNAMEEIKPEQGLLLVNREAITFFVSLAEEK
jgi:hypothetical protein